MDTLDLYSIAQIRQLEKIAIEDLGIDEFELMNSAGKAAFNRLMLTWPNANKIHVICGQGNNGGDGYVLAYYAKKGDLDITLHHLGELDLLPPAARKALELCQRSGLRSQPFNPSILHQADVVVDALLGIGIKNEVRANYHEAIIAINDTKLPVLAIDIPSGLDADTGNILGVAIKATQTITFIGLKAGLFTNNGLDQGGEVHLDDLQLPKKLFESVPSQAHLLLPHILNRLPSRRKNSNKGDFGHVLVVGGDKGMAGAVRLAAEASLRVGAGLVSVATYPGNGPIINAHYPEIMCHEIADAKDLLPLLNRASVVLVGPGLGQRSWGNNLLERVLECELPIVIDADGLNLLGQAPKCKKNWILTPHPGEAARLLGWSSAQEVQNDRFAAITKLSANGGIWVLKGAGTLIKSSEEKISICSAGNPGMASGGMGDALTGVIGGLVAQKLALREATEIGVLLHGLAGDRAAKQGEDGLVASDLIAVLRQTIQYYQSNRDE
jgi:NAD(P)H-hydrate epimerase